MTVPVSDVRQLVAEAQRRGSAEAGTQLEALAAMFDEPFRIAVAGMVKAGKSTLLNALVGEKLAPTDAGECTRIVTWYSEGPGYAVTAVGVDGNRDRLSFERGDELVIDLAGRSAAGIDHLDVRWPSSRLAGRQYVDTPGLGSLSTDVSARAESFLTGGDDVPVDAVVYLLRHRHPADLAFLEAFHGGVGRAGSTNAIAVLSRADELAGGRADALGIARRVADELAVEPRLAGLCQGVVPVAGLLAETASTLRQDEFELLRRFASLGEDEMAELLISAQRVIERPVEGLGDAASRRRLFERFGLHGLRLAVNLLRTGQVNSAGTLATRLRQESGIDELVAEIERRFGSRRDVLRARTALATVERLALDQASGLSGLLSDIERIRAGAHELSEVALLEELRAGAAPDLQDDNRRRLTRLLGGDGADPSSRLGVGADDDPGRVLAAELAHWQRWAENPLATPDTIHLSRAAVRTCEALVATS